MAATPTASPASWSHEISPLNHGALVSIAASLMLAAMLLFLVIRLSIRWPWKDLFGLDDVMTIVAAVFAVGQTAAILRAVHRGLGQHTRDLSASSMDGMSKAIFASDILFLLALTTSRLAVALLLLRLASVRLTVVAAHAIVGLISVWGMASILALAIRPIAASPWMLNEDNTTHLAKVWTGVGATGVLLEALLITLPVILVWSLQMTTGSKMTVVAGFACRLSVVAIAAIRIVAVRNTFEDPTDLAWRSVSLAIYAEVEMHLSLITATIPCMHVFLKNFNTGYLGTTADQVDISATVAATKGSNSYPLSTLRSRHNQNSETQGSSKRKSIVYLGAADAELRPPRGAISTSQAARSESIGEHNADTDSVTSDGSDKIIVRRTVDVEWEKKNSHGH